MSSRHLALAALSALAVQATGIAGATVTFDFESSVSLNSSLISGDKRYFAVTTEQAQGGTQSVKFVEPGPDPFESFTYDVPVSMTSGTITVWFYDARGASALQPNPALAKFGGSVILERTSDPSDFGAVEISELPYGGGRYFGSEGSVDRFKPADSFDSGTFPIRSTGFHSVRFDVTPTTTTVSVDGIASSEVGAPGGSSPLRVRIMNGSASNSGAPIGTPGLPPGYQPNWFTTTVPFASVYSGTPWLFFDDFRFEATLPSVTSATQSFEIISGTPEYDQPGYFMGPTPNDNTFMKGFANQWETTSTVGVAHAGSQAAFFKNNVAAFKSLVFDLSGATPNTTATVWFYDAKGGLSQFPVFDMGGSIIVESASNPANFIAAEIWTAHYPTTSDPTPGTPNYYLTIGIPGGTNTGNLYSRRFGNRSIGWHKAEIFLTNSSSTISIDGQSNMENGTAVTGPGLSGGLKLRLMADSATSGGFANYVGINDVQVNYFETLTPYVYYDNVSLPVPAAAVSDWAMYQ